MAAAADKVTAKLTTFSEGMIMNLSETVQAFKFYFGTLVESIYIATSSGKDLYISHTTLGIAMCAVWHDAALQKSELLVDHNVARHMRDEFGFRNFLHQIHPFGCKLSWFLLWALPKIDVAMTAHNNKPYVRLYSS